MGTEPHHGAGRNSRRRVRAARDGRVGHDAPLNVGDAPLGASLAWVEVKVRVGRDGGGAAIWRRRAVRVGGEGRDSGGSLREGEVEVVGRA